VVVVADLPVDALPVAINGRRQNGIGKAVGLAQRGVADDTTEMRRILAASAMEITSRDATFSSRSIRLVSASALRARATRSTWPGSAEG